MTTAASESPLREAVGNRWWLLALRGVISILFGIMAFMWPGLTVLSLVLLWGAFAFTDGIAAIGLSLRRHWWGMFFVGLLGIAAGLIALFSPGITALSLLYLIGLAAIFRGVLEIVAAIQLRKVIENEWLLVLAGLASVFFGVVVCLFPGVGALSVIWLISMYAIAFGVITVALSFRLRRLHPASL